MSYNEKLEQIRTLEAEYSKLMKQSFDKALTCRDTSNHINQQALLLKQKIENLKETETSF